jgi:hypothetical protein
MATDTLTPELDAELDAGSIVVGERTRDVHAYQTDGSVKTLGKVITRNYRGEHAQRHAFVSAEDQKLYKLGVSTNQFRFVDHTVALDPMMNRGYTLKDAVYSRGGVHMYAVLERPDAAEIQDPMSWDLQYWHDARGEGLNRVPRQLRESVVVFSSVRPGKGIKYNRGWFRLICTNGLVAEVMKLGAAKLNHVNWASENVVKGLRLTDRLETVDMGPVAGSARGARRLADLLDQFATLPETESIDPEDGTAGPSIERAVAELPLFIQDEVSTFLTMPQWFRGSLSAQFRALADGKAKNEKVFVLDVTNAVTNPINLERITEEPRSVLRPLMRQATMITAAAKMIGAYSL